MRTDYLAVILVFLLPWSAWCEELSMHVGVTGRRCGVYSNWSSRASDNFYVKNHDGTGYQFEVGLSKRAWQGYIAYGKDIMDSDSWNRLPVSDESDYVKDMWGQIHRYHVILGGRYKFAPKSEHFIHILLGGFISYGLSKQSYSYGTKNPANPSHYYFQSLGSGLDNSYNWGGGGEVGLWFPFSAHLTGLITGQIDYHGVTTSFTPMSEKKYRNEVADLSLNLGLQYRITLRKS
ncbi:MAG: hypothetical protein ACOZB3_10440 [Calditrichota bacterium]